MITVYFKNEEYARLPTATQVQYSVISVQRSGGALSVLICQNAAGKEVGVFLLSEIVGWSFDEEEEEDEDEEDEEEDDEEEDD